MIEEPGDLRRTWLRLWTFSPDATDDISNRVIHLSELIVDICIVFVVVMVLSALAIVGFVCSVSVFIVENWKLR